MCPCVGEGSGLRRPLVQTGLQTPAEVPVTPAGIRILAALNRAEPPRTVHAVTGLGQRGRSGPAQRGPARSRPHCTLLHRS